LDFFGYLGGVYITINSYRFTVNRTTGIGEDNYEVEAILSSHIPEILPISGRRLHVSYKGQLKQCKNCYSLGHIVATCESQKVEWLEYVATLYKSGKFKAELFDGWLSTLKLHRSDFKEPTQSNIPQTSGLDLSNIARNSTSNNQNRGFQHQNQRQWNHNIPNQGATFAQNNSYYRLLF